ncbi:hypothetical protein [Photobacterium leiognathi]|uniref:Type 4 fimbrial biogenesis protein PilX N-terminal domain-containing protein n=1 Tax=Photobacterium leiognathi subsp. mandapamensis TaxID=48408 RepID=A0A2T3KWE8_PHOLD|nr:hypothetical protein [Photobacterium leiognathi]PSV11553.1 hypothetical protein C0W93_09110 [Photobacterium leiognathi subsp. mandapamensis]
MRNKYQQSGMTTLLITSLLLIVALLFSLASYKNLFYQIKRTQNEVLARQAHWIAEGGIECGFSKVKQENNLNNILNVNYFNSDCNNSKVSVDVNVVDTGKYQFSVISNINPAFKNIRKNIVAGSNRSSGTIKATSDLIIDSDGGNSDMYPDPGIKNGSDYECVLLRYAGTVKIIGTFANKGLHYAYPPYDGFYTGDAGSYPNCLGNYQSTVVDSMITESNKPSVFGDDYIKDIVFDPFFDTFSVKREEWKEGVRDKSTVISGSNTCSTDIATSISSDSDRIWVVGDCDLGSSVSEIQSKIDSVGLAGIILIVQDGILSIDGAFTLDALIYHFKSPESSFVPTETKWNLLSAGDELTSAEKSYVAYFQNGAFHPKGGYVLDAPGLTAKFRGSLNFSFNSDVFKDALDDLKEVKWQKGSWNDL